MSDKEETKGTTVDTPVGEKEYYLDTHEGGRTGLYCSFCRKHQDDVWKMIAGPGVYVCDECVELCAQIMSDEMGGKADSSMFRVAVCRSDGTVSKLEYGPLAGSFSTWLKLCHSCRTWLVGEVPSECPHCGQSLAKESGKGQTQST